MGRGYILSVSAFPPLHGAWHHSRTSEVLLELKGWPQAPGAVWVCRVPRHVGAQRVSCLRIVTLLLFRGGNGGPGRRGASPRPCNPFVALKGFLMPCSWPLGSVLGLPVGQEWAVPALPNCLLSVLSPPPMCSRTLCQRERKCFGGEEEDGVEEDLRGREQGWGLCL